MAGTTSLNEYADSFPALVGWYRCGAGYTSTLTFNSLNLCPGNPHVYPLRARIRLYDQGRKIHESCTEPIHYKDLKVLKLNALLDRDVEDGLMEINVFSQEEEGLKEGFYNEVWVAVYTEDGKTHVNFPVMIARGADPSMIDASYLYYPGVVVSDLFEPVFVVMNHHDFENHYELFLYDASGKRKLGKKFMIPPKTLERKPLTLFFGDLEVFFSEGPGLLVFHYEYKMNAYVQTLQRKKQILTGMDHVSILFAAPGKETSTFQQKIECQSKRLDDPVICYCTARSEKEIRQWLDTGLSMEEIMEKHDVGRCCLGCVPDLERISGKVLGYL